MCPVRVDILGSTVNQDKKNVRRWDHQAILPSRRNGSTEVEDEGKEKKMNPRPTTMIAARDDPVDWQKLRQSGKAVSRSSVTLQMSCTMQFISKACLEGQFKMQHWGHS